MTAWARLKSTLANLLGRPRARFESATWNRDRAWLPTTYQSPNYDAPPATRKTLVSKSRYWEKNSPLFNRLADLWEQYTTGTGLRPNPASSSADWNTLARDRWEAWAETADLATDASIYAQQSIWARAWFVDGEALVLRVSNSPATLKIQTVEAHRLETPDQFASEPLCVDGIWHDLYGRPQRYYITETRNSEKIWRPWDRADVHHVFEPARPEQARGLPLCYPALNDIQALDQLQQFELLAAQDAARISRIIKSASGEADPSSLYRSGTTTGPDGKDRAAYYEEILGAEVKILQAGDAMEQFQSARPSEATAKLWRILTEKVCAAVGIPYVLAFPESTQGTVYRGAIDSAAAFFRIRSAVPAAATARIYSWWLKWAVLNDPVIAAAKRPSDWARVTITPPRAINVDAGRNSAAALAELAAGATTLEDYYGALGRDWQEALRQRAREQAFIRDLAKSLGLDPAQVSNLAAAPQPTPIAP